MYLYSSSLLIVVWNISPTVLSHMQYTLDDNLDFKIYVSLEQLQESLYILLYW
jgi:hypothetical protein